MPDSEISLVGSDDELAILAICKALWVVQCFPKPILDTRRWTDIDKGTSTTLNLSVLANLTSLGRLDVGGQANTTFCELGESLAPTADASAGTF